MSISELFRYRNDNFQSEIFSSDIGITEVDVGCRISPTLRSMSMPTFGYSKLLRTERNHYTSGSLCFTALGDENNSLM